MTSHKVWIRLLYVLDAYTTVSTRLRSQYLGQNCIYNRSPKILTTNMLFIIIIIIIIINTTPKLHKTYKYIQWLAACHRW